MNFRNCQELAVSKAHLQVQEEMAEGQIPSQVLPNLDNPDSQEYRVFFRACIVWPPSQEGCSLTTQSHVGAGTNLSKQSH